MVYFKSLGALGHNDMDLFFENLGICKIYLFCKCFLVIFSTWLSHCSKRLTIMSLLAEISLRSCHIPLGDLRSYLIGSSMSRGIENSLCHVDFHCQMLTCLTAHGSWVEWGVRADAACKTFFQDHTESLLHSKSLNVFWNNMIPLPKSKS